MMYYYVINNDRLGPVEETELATLLQIGTISNRTLVWREGMASWAPLGFVLPGLVPGAAGFANQTPPPGPQSAAAAPASAQPYVGFWARVGASIIDGFLTSFVAQIAGGVIGFAIGMSMASAGADEEEIVLVAQLFGALLGCLIDWLYRAIMESSSLQATLGKLAIGAKVVDASGNRISFGRATARHFGKIISALIFFIGFMMVGWDERKQGLHDKMAGTFVVHK